MSVISEKWNYFLSNFRNFCFAEDTRHSEKFKLIWFFIRYFVILPQ